MGGRLRIASGQQALGFYSRALVLPEDGLLAVREGGKIRRSYRGTLSFEPGPEGLQIVNRVALNDYLKSVVPSEMGGEAPSEAFKAQAVVARTWTLVHLGKHREEGFDLCDLTHCQSYQGADWERMLSSLAVDSTAGEIATYEGEPILAFYHSTCGGHTANAEGIWGDIREPYLTGIADSSGGQAFCQGSEQMHWRFAISLPKLRRALALTPETDPGRVLKDVRPAAYEESGRVSRLQILGSQGKDVSGEAFRTAVCKALGWNTVKSTWFTIYRQKGRLILVGRGFGHGVGMCQNGARSRALSGEDYHQIIAAYFPGVKVARREDENRETP